MTDHEDVDLDEDDDASLHPRMRERRAEVEDASLRRRNRKLMAVGGLILAGLLAFAATQSPLLDVDEVRVIGAQRGTPEFFRDAAAVELGAPILGLDTEVIENRLRVLPEIRDVLVSSDWGGVVTIEVSERMPVARIATNDGVAVVAADGKVIEVINALEDLPQEAQEDVASDAAAEPDVAVVPQVELTEAIADLPEISGAMFSTDSGEQVPDVLSDALVVASELPVDIAAITDRIEITVDSLVLRVVGGGSISVGDARDLDDKFEAVRAFLLQVDLTCLDSLNVSAPTVPVIIRSAC